MLKLALFVALAVFAAVLLYQQHDTRGRVVKIEQRQASTCLDGSTRTCRRLLNRLLTSATPRQKRILERGQEEREQTIKPRQVIPPPKRQLAQEPPREEAPEPPPAELPPVAPPTPEAQTTNETPAEPEPAPPVEPQPVPDPALPPTPTVSTPPEVCVLPELPVCP